METVGEVFMVEELRDSPFEKAHGVRAKMFALLPYHSCVALLKKLTFVLGFFVRFSRMRHAPGGLLCRPLTSVDEWSVSELHAPFLSRSLLFVRNYVIR